MEKESLGLPREALASLVAEGLSVPAMAERLLCTPAMVRRSLGRHGLQSRSSANRARARTALERGDRVVDLVCRRHGMTRYVLVGQRHYRCARCRAERVAERRRKVKQILVAEAGGRCQLCGYERCSRALGFHHVDPASKSFTVGFGGLTRSIARARAEAGKCVLLCANCHMEVEADSE